MTTKTPEQLAKDLAKQYAWDKWDTGESKDKQIENYEHEMRDSEIDFLAGYAAAIRECHDRLEVRFPCRCIDLLPALPEGEK